MGEFYAFAEYLKNWGIEPRLLIVGVDGFNFFVDDVAETIPEHIVRNEKPPSIVFDYLSIESLKFSIKTLFGRSPWPRYYTSNFTAAILPDAPTYEPNMKVEQMKMRMKFSESGFVAERLVWYEKLGQLFPDARVLYYVPPVSAWRIAVYETRSDLDNYVRAIYSVASVGHDLYDFSYPSDITRDRTRTYDGSHYDVAVNNEIAEKIMTGKGSFGVKVNELSYSEYRDLFVTDPPISSM